MSAICGKALWGIICGETVLASDEVVGAELEAGAKNLLEGLSFYKPWNEDEHKKWIQTTKLKKDKQNFVTRLGKLLDLTSEQAWSIFSLFLQHEYRGSLSQLSGALANDREETVLFHQVLSFYMSDQIHLLNCRRFLIENIKHPYQQLFKDFVDKMIDPDKSWGPKLVSQLSSLAGDALNPPKMSQSPLLPPNAEQTWITHRLAAIKHQLATLLVYYGSPGKKCSPQSALTLLQLAQGGGLGWALLESVDRYDRSVFTSQLESINAIHCILLVLIISPDDPIESHPLCDPEWIKKLDPVVRSFGSKQWHLPPLLAWSIVQGKNASKKHGEDSPEVQTYANLARRGIRANLFDYLNSILSNSMFQTKMDYVLYKISTYVSYSLLCLAGSCFELDSLGLTASVQSLGNTCVSMDGITDYFWNESSGLAAVILPAALEVFPHSPQYLIRLCSSLASHGGQESCQKVIEMFSELETLTWPLIGTTPTKISISNAQVVTTGDCQLIPGVVIPTGVHGTLVDYQSQDSLICWQLPTNGWQILLGAFKALEIQIGSGVATDDWLLQIVISGLSLMRSVVIGEQKQLNALIHLVESARLILISVAKVVKPHPELMTALLEFFAETSKIISSTVWMDLDGTSLLPSVPTSFLKSKKCDIASGYRAGALRSLICGTEAASGSYPILKSLITLLESAIRGQLSHSHINGSMVFIIKEVLPVMLQWCYKDVTEKVDCMKQIFSLLYLTIKEKSLEEGLILFIVSELIGSSSGAGRTLRVVLDGGSSLGGILDSPCEWPRSEHSKKFAEMSCLALSLTQKLVSEYLNWNQDDKNQGTDIFGGSALKSLSTGPNRLSKGPPHIALTIARYVHLRVDPRLSFMALRTLTHIAEDLRVPLVACLSTEAEGLRDCLLNRLGSATEDLLVKKALLRLLTASCHQQPGIIRLFLTPPKPLLQAVVALFYSHQEGTSNATKDLIECLVETVAALWKGNFTIAQSFLRENKQFWEAMSNCLCKNKPDSIDDGIVGNILQIFALEYFESTDKVCEGLEKVMTEFFDSSKNNFSLWCEYILVSTIDSLSDMETTKTPAMVLALLQSSKDFFIIIVKRAKKTLSDDQKTYLGEMALKGLRLSLQSGQEEMWDIQIILAEIHLALLHECASEIVSAESYRLSISHLLSHLRANVMQTSAKCQVFVLAAAVRALISCSSKQIAQDLSSVLVDSVLLIAEQHSSVTSPSEQQHDTSSIPFTTPGVLALSCSLLHHCLINIPVETVEQLMLQSNLRHSLIVAAATYTNAGNASVVKEILRLIALFARLLPVCQEVKAANLGTSVSLSLLSQQEEVNIEILPDLFWCVVYCMEREGSAELDDAISIVALHMSTIKKCLEDPHQYPKMALAAASLCQVLVPHQALWRVLHPQCFEQLIHHTACCVQRCTRLLQLREALEREVVEAEAKIPTKAESETSSATDALINQLLKVLGTCLQTLQYMSPDLVELLCCPGMDLTSWDRALFQPTCRRINNDHPETLPNLATLADVLYLYNIVLPKDCRSSPLKIRPAASGIDVNALTICAENALVLLLSHSALLLISPDVHRRDAREVRTFLADETESFFSHILGKKSISTSPSSGGISLPNMPFLKLCSQLVSSICQTKVS